MSEWRGYETTEPSGSPNWGWLDLWLESNPRPDDRRDFDSWWEQRRAMSDRVWVAFCLPQFRVWEWSEEDVAMAVALTSRHICGCCGRSDDRGCWEGC